MSDIALLCPTCPDPFLAPQDSDGTVRITPSTLTVVQSSTGPRFVALCPQCADLLVGGGAPDLSPT